MVSFFVGATDGLMAVVSDGEDVDALVIDMFIMAVMVRVSVKGSSRFSQPKPVM